MPFLSRSLSAPSVVLALLLCSGLTMAQVPDGYWVVSSGRDPATGFFGTGGLHVVHPRNSGCMTAITGVPAPLQGTNTFYSGANSVVIHPSGDLLVGDYQPAGAQVGVWRLNLTGLAISGSAFLPVGVGMAVDNQVAQTHLLNPGQLLIGCSNLQSTAFPTAGSEQIGILDLVTGAVTPLLNRANPGGILNALSFDSAAQTIFYAMAWSNVTSTIYSLPLAGGTPTLVASTTGWIQGLAMAPGGGLFAAIRQSAPGAAPALAHVAANGTVTPLVTNWQLFSAIAIEPSTGMIALCGTSVLGGAPNGVHLVDPAAPAVNTLAMAPCSGMRGPLSGIAVAPDPVPYGMASGGTGGAVVQWAIVPRPTGLPQAGAQWTVGASWSGATPVLVLAVFGLGSRTPPAPVPPFGVLSNLDMTRLLPGTIPLSLQTSQNTSVMTVSLPASPALVGSTFFAQALHFMAAGQLMTSDGLRISIL